MIQQLWRPSSVSAHLGLAPVYLADIVCTRCGFHSIDDTQPVMAMQLADLLGCGLSGWHDPGVTGWYTDVSWLMMWWKMVGLLIMIRLSRNRSSGWLAWLFETISQGSTRDKFKPQNVFFPATSINACNIAVVFTIIRNHWKRAGSFNSCDCVVWLIWHESQVLAAVFRLACQMAACFAGCSFARYCWISVKMNKYKRLLGRIEQVRQRHEKIHSGQGFRAHKVGLDAWISCTVCCVDFDGMLDPREMIVTIGVLVQQYEIAWTVCSPKTQFFSVYFLQ